MRISDWSSDVCSSDLQLVRTFGSGMGPSWQHSYAVESVAELESYLSGMAIDWQWLPKGWLRTCQIRPAIHVHPGTGDELWFNHIAFWHSSSMEESVRARFEADFGVGQSGRASGRERVCQVV